MPQKSKFESDSIVKNFILLSPLYLYDLKVPCRHWYPRMKNMSLIAFCLLLLLSGEYKIHYNSTFNLTITCDNVHSILVLLSTQYFRDLRLEWSEIWDLWYPRFERPKIWEIWEIQDLRYPRSEIWEIKDSFWEAEGFWFQTDGQTLVIVKSPYSMNSKELRYWVLNFKSEIGLLSTQ